MYMDWCIFELVLMGVYVVVELLIIVGYILNVICVVSVIVSVKDIELW